MDYADEEESRDDDLDFEGKMNLKAVISVCRLMRRLPNDRHETNDKEDNRPEVALVEYAEK